MNQVPISEQVPISKNLCNFSSNRIITEWDLIDALSAMSNSLTPGPDGIPYIYWTIVLFKGSLINNIVLKLFNDILKYSSVPSSWKISYIFP